MVPNSDMTSRNSLFFLMHDRLALFTKMVTMLAISQIEILFQADGGFFHDLLKYFLPLEKIDGKMNTAHIRKPNLTPYKFKKNILFLRINPYPLISNLLLKPFLHELCGMFCLDL